MSMPPVLFRNICGVLVVLLLAVASTGVGCAGSSEKAEPDEAPVETRRHADEAIEGPFEVARAWVDDLDDHDLSGEPADIVDEWSVASLARVWASGDEYRAVVTQKNTAEEAPAVLLHVAKGDGGTWEVVDVEPTTANHLWPKL